MELAELMGQRRSIRGYRRKPVPEALIREIIEIASGAPSSMNTAPLRREIRLHRKYEAVHRDRQVEIAYQLFDAMGIRDDRDMRHDWMMRGFRQFDARPCRSSPPSTAAWRTRPSPTSASVPWSTRSCSPHGTFDR